MYRNAGDFLTISTFKHTKTHEKWSEPSRKYTHTLRERERYIYIYIYAPSLWMHLLSPSSLSYPECNWGYRLPDRGGHRQWSEAGPAFVDADNSSEEPVGAKENPPGWHICIFKYVYIYIYTIYIYIYNINIHTIYILFNYNIYTIYIYTIYVYIYI